jgi:putative membrane protein
MRRREPLAPKSWQLRFYSWRELWTDNLWAEREYERTGALQMTDEDVRKIAEDAITRLNSLQGAEFDNAYADAQLRVQTAAVAQYGAFSQNGADGSLRRHAERTLPQSQSLLEAAKRLAGGR